MTREARPFTLVSSLVQAQTPIFALRVDRAQHPRSGHEGNYVVLESPNWVNVVAETESGALVLVRQWRHGSRAIELEIPGGLVDGEEDALAAAARELREETGYEAAALQVLGTMRPNPAFMSNTCTLVWARGCRLVHDLDLDDSEDVETLLATRDEVERWIGDGTIGHGIVLLALLMWMRSSPR